MIRRTVTLALALALAAMAAEAMASSETYACKLTSRQTNNHPWGKVDRVIIDEELDRVELKEAHSASNPTPYNWVFENGIVGMHKNTLVVEKQDQGIFGTGLGDQASYSFALTNDGLLRWVFVESKLMYQLEWKCEKSL